jgi:uncharacterized protein YegP (UPF0339 family)
MNNHVIIKEAQPINGKKRWMLIVKGRNNKVLVTSETFNSKAAAINNIAAVYEVLKEVNWAELYD